MTDNDRTSTPPLSGALLQSKSTSTFSQQSNVALATNAALSATSGRKTIGGVGGQLPAIQNAALTRPKRNTQRVCRTSRERTEAARTAIRAVPAARQLPSSKQLRALLNALMRTPVGIVQQVGFVLMLFVSVLEASLPAGGAPPAASIADCAAATAVRSNTVVTTDERNRAVKIVAFAKAKRMRGDRFMRKGGEAVEKRANNIKTEAIRRWAVRRNQKMKQLRRLLDATTEIGVDEALLVEYHAGGIKPREAGKALSAAAAVLHYVTRVSGDAIAKSRTDAAATSGSVEEIEGAVALQELYHHGANAERRPRKDVLPAGVAAAETRTAVIRVQALARGVATRRTLCTSNAAATLVQPYVRARQARREVARRFAAAVRTQSAAGVVAAEAAAFIVPEGRCLRRDAVVIQALWRSVMSRRTLLCKTMAAIAVQRWSRSTTVVRSLARTREVAQAQGAHVVQVAAMCAELRFRRAVCKLSASMSARCRVYRTAVTLLQRGWLKTVKDVSLAARGHVFGEAEMLLGSMIRRRSQQIGPDRVIRWPIGSRRDPKIDSANMGSSSPNATCLEVVDGPWLVAAKALLEEERSPSWGRIEQETTQDSSSSDSNCVARQQSSSMDPEIESGSSSNEYCRTSAALATEVTPPSPLVSVSTASSGSRSDNDSTSSVLGGSILECESTLSFRAKSSDSKVHHSVGQRSEDGRETGISGGQEGDRMVYSQVDTPGTLLAQQPDIMSPMDAAMTLSFGGNHTKRVGDPSPTLQQAMVTLDEAIVWPVASSVKAEEATALGAEELPYGGGQIIGHDGEIISSKKQYVPSFSLPRTPSPRRRREKSRGTSLPETPGSPDRPWPSTSPSTPPSLRRRRRRTVGRSSARRLRIRSPPLSVFRVPTACRSWEVVSTPRSSPDRLRSETDSVSTSCCLVSVANPVTEAEGSSQAERIVPVLDSATKEDVSSSQTKVETAASDLLVSALPAAANVGSASRDSGRPKLKWGLYGTCHLRRRPACSATGGKAMLPVAQVRPTVCIQSKLRQEQLVHESDDDDYEADASPMGSTAGRPHGKSVNGWGCWRRRVDESLEASIFPPARFRKFRTCPRYWCYLDYVLSEQELAMCARLPAILVGGGASVLIADAVEEHGRPAVEIALERSVRNAFNGGSRHIRRVRESSEEVKINGDSSPVFSGSSSPTAARAGPGKATKAERTDNADVGLRHAREFLDASVVDGESELAAQCGTSLQEQERALEQCKAHRCSAPLSAPGSRGENTPLADAGPRCARTSSERVAEDGKSGLAALYGTSLREQERALALCRGRQSDIPGAVSRSTKISRKGLEP